MSAAEKMPAAFLDLLDALAVAEVEDYMTAQATPGNDPGPARPNHPATGDAREAA